jgi:hypothetical protein
MLWVMGYGLWVVGYGLRVVGWVVDCDWWVVGFGCGFWLVGELLVMAAGYGWWDAVPNPVCTSTIEQ